MKLFDILFEAFKFTWKEKPMWKFILVILTPIILITTLLIMGLAVFLILSDDSFDIPFTIGETGYIILIIGILLTTLIYITTYFGGTIGTQLGSNSIAWHHYLSPTKKMDRESIFRTSLNQVLPSLPYFLLFIILPYCVLFAVYFLFIFYIQTAENELVMLLLMGSLFLFVPIIYIGFYLLHLVLPVAIHDYIGFTKRFQLVWAYISSIPLKLLLYSLLVGVADFIANSILYIPYYIFSMIIMIPFILGIPLLDSNPNAAILLFIAMIVLYSIVVTTYSIAQLLLITFKQSAFTRIYCQWYENSDLAKQIAPLHEQF